MILNLLARLLTNLKRDYFLLYLAVNLYAKKFNKLD